MDHKETRNKPMHQYDEVKHWCMNHGVMLDVD